MLIPNLPFIWRIPAQKKTPVFGMPTRLPFHFGYAGAFGLLRQLTPPVVLCAVDAIEHQDRTPEDARISTMDTNLYYLPFYQFVCTVMRDMDRRPSRTIDVGCGDGHLVYLLDQISGEAMGTDPAFCGPPRSDGLQIHRYTPASPAEFDLITHHHVLEHVDSPLDFLCAWRDRLSENGIMIFAVPNCQESIALGDISMALHQHLSYFTETSLIALMTDARLELLHIGRPAGGEGRQPKRANGSSIFVACRRSQKRYEPITPPDEWTRFSRLAADNVGRFKTRIQAAQHAGSVGMYVPLRAVPYLAAAGIFTGQVRFFDDGLAGRFLDGIQRPIEGREDLLRNPVDSLFIMSLTADVAIKKALGLIEYPDHTVTTLREILEL